MALDRNPNIINWHAVPLETVISNLKTDTASGLTKAEASNRIVAYGRNELPRGHTVTWWEMLFRQFKSPLVYILVIASVFTIWLKEWVDTTVIILSVIVNTLIGFYQEYHANHLLEKLKAIIRVEAFVIRAGGLHHLEAEELVPGDIIELKTGAKVPADSRLIEVHHLEAGEAVLTGESTPVKKNLTVVASEAQIGDRHNMVWMGTTIEQGAGRAVVVATGAKTEIGKLAALTMEAEEETTPLQERLKKLANVISLVVGISALVIFLIGLFEGLGWIDVFTTAVAVAVSAIPEGLVAALSVVLAVSTQRILKRQGLVRRPIAAETLGSVTVICADKTGTLTEGVMKVEKFMPDGPSERPLLCLALANEAVREDINGEYRIHGEATDRAKLEYALNNGLDLTAVNHSYPKRAFLPFDSSVKYIAAFHGDTDAVESIHCFVSGAPEILLAKSNRHGDGRPMLENDRQKIIMDIEALAGEGYRLIGLADRIIKEGVDPDDDEALHRFMTDLTFRGLVAVRDPIRADVKETLRLTRRAGVRVIMVTGDHRLTAMAIGSELGFRSGENNVVDGIELDSYSDEDLAKAIHHIDICVRVNPEHKLRIVRALLKNGEAVAMTGDGVNDAPALKAADIGVAVGSATDVTKEAADLVLLNDGLSTIVGAIREGRVAFDNIKKVTILLLSGSFTAFLLVMASLVLGLPLPLSAVQILWGNLVENGLPNFALAFEPAEPDVMDRRPISRSAPVLDSAGKMIVFGIALLRDFLLIGVFYWYYVHWGGDLAYVRTIIFALLSTDSLFYIFSIKSFHQPLWQENFFDNWYLLFSIGLGFAMMIPAVYLPVMNRFLGTIPLSARDAAVVIGIALLDVCLIEVVKLYYNRRVDTKNAIAVS
ncbi:hypothetical protein A3H10_02480 [Candidatus Uhrbacteria bacterium RIFCSPLOWO2_12_FULL_46_10]|nr:MAG: hypothetical protein A3H10_02480 [Candidatus Uhrbacteria bacterium RIFCSPLOWO2_12_FULL_46_10]